MKNFLKLSSALLLSFSISFNVFAQPRESKNGVWLSPSGTIRVLVIFIEVNYDVGSDPSPGTPDWPAGQLPIWADDLFDVNVPSGPATGKLTRYFQLASSGNYNLLGDYLLHPVNGVFTVNRSNAIVPLPDPDPNTSYAPVYGVVAAEINNAMGGNFVTGSGLSTSDFDLWDGYLADLCLPKVNTPDGNYDHVMFIWRNGDFFASGTGMSVGTQQTPLILGHVGDTYSHFVTHSALPLEIARHEYSHLLLGSNNFHMAGGWGSQSLHLDYWIQVTNGWSMLSLSWASLMTWNAWDRQRLDWKPTGNQFNPSCRNQLNTAEMDGDLDATVSADAGYYYLRDFVTTGDAIRIKLPYLTPGAEYPEYIWIENHNGEAMNGISFDKWQGQGGECIEPAVYGLYMYMQVGQDVRQAAFTPAVIGTGSNFANYLRPLTAEGFYDKVYEPDHFLNCPENSTASAKPFIRAADKQNPFTGCGDQEWYMIDLDNNDILETMEGMGNEMENVGENYYTRYYNYGNSRNVFTQNGNKKIGIGTNPSTSTLMNLVSYEAPVPTTGVFNVRKAYLNGISVEIVDQFASGGIVVQVRFDDVDVDNDIRWCGDEIVLNPIPSSSGYSVNVKSGKTVTIDWGLTPTRIDNPQLFLNGNKVFSSPTVFRCLAGSYFHLEPNATLIVDNACRLTLEANSTFEIESGAQLIVRNSSALYLEEGSNLIVQDGGKVIIESTAALEYGVSNNGTPANIALEGLDAVLEIQGALNIRDNSTFTFTYSTPLHGYVKFSSTAVPSDNITCGANCSMRFEGTNKLRKVLEITQESVYTPDNLVAFTCSTGTVAMGEGSRLQMSGGQTVIDFYNTRVTSTIKANTPLDPNPYNAHRGLTLFGQQNVTVNSCLFEYGKYGIYGYLTYGGAPLTVTNSTFRHCGMGLYTQDKGVRLVDCFFRANASHGWKADYMAFPSTTQSGIWGGSDADANPTGIYYHGFSGSSLFMSDPLVTYNNTGVRVYRAPLYVQCGSISNNSLYGIHAGLFSHLDMSYDVFSTGQAAQVTAVNNGITIFSDGAAGINLDGGNNNLAPPVNVSQAAINGALFFCPLSYTLYAEGNQWNAGNTPISGSDYFLQCPDPLFVPVTIVDNTPITPVPCGQANPCIDCEERNALYTCPDCEEIYTENFYNEQLNEATITAIDKTKDVNETNNYRQAISLFHEILTSEITNPTENEEYVLSLGYKKMLEALGSAFSTGQITRDENLASFAPEVEKTLEVLNAIIEESSAVGEYYKRYLASIEKAQVYRIADRRELALPVLDDILTWAGNDDIEYVQGLRCAVNIEHLVLNDEIDRGEVEVIMESPCSYVPGAGGRMSANNSIVIDEATLSVVPNPVTTAYTVTTYVPEDIMDAQLVVYDLVGSKVSITNVASGINKLEINNSGLKNGIYFFTLQGNGATMSKVKVAVVK